MKRKKTIPFVILLFLQANFLLAQVCFNTPVNFGYGQVMNPNCLCSGDFNGDSFQDIAVVNPGADNLSLMLGNGTGSFSLTANFATGTHPRSIISADLNNDSKLDLVVANDGSDNISVLLGNGLGSFSTATNFSVGTTPYTVCSGDFNADGKLDLAIGNWGSDNISVVIGNGLGSFSSATNYSVPSRPFSIVSADFNNDGKADLAVTNNGFYRVSVFIGNGTGGFGAATNFLVGSGPQGLTKGDFNSDGNMDLAVAMQGLNKAAVIFGDGTGSFGVASTFSTGTFPTSVVSGDFNSDGKADLVLSNSGTDDVSVLIGNGAGSFAAARNFSTDVVPEYVIVADFNGDGKLDLATANSNGNSNDVSILLNGPPLVTANANNAAVCTGGSVILNGGGATTYSWTNSVSDGVSFVPSSTQTYTVTGTHVTGCTNTATITITVNPLPTLSVTATSNTICSGDYVTLTGTGATTYTWTGGINNGVAFIPGASMAYTLTATDANGCVNSSIKNITVNSLPVVTANASLNVLCVGDLITLTGSGTATSYSWTGGVTNAVPFPASASQTFTVNGTDANGCTNKDTKTITVNSLPLISINASDTIICDGDAVTLNGTGATSYSWTGGIVDGLSFNPTSTQAYTVTGTDGNNCTNTAAKTIVVNSLPIVICNATKTTLCQGAYLTLTGSGALNYTWTGGVTDGVAFPASSTQTYSVTGQDGNNCFNNASISINVSTPQTPEICMITSDSMIVGDSTKYNIIFWNKTLYSNVDSFIIYREVSTGIYYQIGSVSKDSLSLFKDTVRHIGIANGNPMLGAYRYKLQIRDTCGNYSAQSLYHNTVHFIDNHSGTFQWNTYDVETQVTPVANFILMRDDNNTGAWHSIGSAVAGTQISLSDPSYSTYQFTANWRVEATGFNCTPTMFLGNNNTQGTVVKSRSNVKNNRTTTINYINGNSQISVYPQPASNEVVVNLGSLQSKTTIELYNTLGDLIVRENLQNSNTAVLNLQNLPAGVYSVIIITENGKTVKKLVKE